jgi:dTDP-4-dehydrorhamnose reductase
MGMQSKKKKSSYSPIYHMMGTKLCTSIDFTFSILDISQISNVGSLDRLDFTIFGQ